MSDMGDEQKKKVLSGDEALQVAPASGGAITINGSVSGGTLSDVTWSTGTSGTLYPMTGTFTLPGEKKPEPEPEPKKIIDLPTKVTKKVVIGFVEDDDTIVWSAKVALIDFQIDFQAGDGRIMFTTGVEDEDTSEEA